MNGARSAVRASATVGVVLAAGLSGACSSGAADEPTEPPPALADALATYSAVHDDVTKYLADELPDVTWTVKEQFPDIVEQPDGTCILWLSGASGENDHAMTPAIAETMAAGLEASLDEHGFAGPTDLEEAEHGGSVRMEATDPTGWTVTVSDLYGQYMVLRVHGPVDVETCDDSVLTS